MVKMFKFKVGKTILLLMLRNSILPQMLRLPAYTNIAFMWLLVNVVLTKCYEFSSFVPSGNRPFVKNYSSIVVVKIDSISRESRSKSLQTVWGSWWDKHRYGELALTNFKALWLDHVIQKHDQRTWITKENRNWFGHLSFHFLVL